MLAVWIHTATTTCFDFGFDLHVGPPLTVVVYASTYTAFKSRFRFHSAFLSLFRMWNRYERRRIN